MPNSVLLGELKPASIGVYFKMVKLEIAIVPASVSKTVVLPGQNEVEMRLIISKAGAAWLDRNNSKHKFTTQSTLKYHFTHVNLTILRELSRGKTQFKSIYFGAKASGSFAGLAVADDLVDQSVVQHSDEGCCPQTRVKACHDYQRFFLSIFGDFDGRLFSHFRPVERKKRAFTRQHIFLKYCLGLLLPHSVQISGP